MEYIVGQRVMIANDHMDDSCGNTSCASFVFGMTALKGKIATITHREEYKDSYTYRISVGDSITDWWWSGCMFASLLGSVGDIIVNKRGDKRKVLGTYKDIYFVSKRNKFTQLGAMYTEKDLKRRKYEVWKGDKDEI